jgi:hypothetical protein
VLFYVKDILLLPLVAIGKAKVPWVLNTRCFLISWLRKPQRPGFWGFYSGNSAVAKQLLYKHG